MTQIDIEKVAASLAVRGASKCPVCSGELGPFHEYIWLPGGPDSANVNINSITPAVALACTNCGYLSLHLAGPLGLV